MSSTAKSRLGPLKKQPAYLLVFEALENEILSGRLNEGDAIPTEMALCEQFNVQRSTIREGIRLLEQTGLVQRGAGKRLLVARPAIAEAAASASRGLERHGVRFADIWEALSVIMPSAAELAAQRMQDESINTLAHITSALAATEDTEEVVALGVRYLEAVYMHTENRVFAVVLHSLNLLVQTSLQQVIGSLPQAKERIHDAQLAMNDAFRKGNPKQAAEWMTRHIDDLRRGYEVAGVDLYSEVGVFDR